MKTPIEIPFLVLSAFAIVLYASSLRMAAAQQQQVHTGTLFNFVPSLGACGFTNTSTQVVASVSNTVFSTFPGASSNPNKNPICHRKVLIRTPTSRTTVTAQVVDFFTSTATGSVNNVGLSDVGFQQFAPLGDGVVPNITWVFV